MGPKQTLLGGFSVIKRVRKAHSVRYFESQNGPAAQPDRAAVPNLSRRFVVDKRLYARSLRAKSELKISIRVARGECTLAFRSCPMNGH
jgi:hypothetical protein